MYKSIIPVPTGTGKPTITFSVTPFSCSISPVIEAVARVGTVISKAARANTLSLVPAIPCLPIDFKIPVEVIKSATSKICRISTSNPCSSSVEVISLIKTLRAASIHKTFPYIIGSTTLGINAVNFKHLSKIRT